MKLSTIFLTFFFTISLHGVDYKTLQSSLEGISKHFNYPLELKIIVSAAPDPHTLVCFHGTGANSNLGSVIASYGIVPDHIVSFNFPDYNLYSRGISWTKSSHGTIYELLPALLLLKKLAVDAGETKISIYGFSSGAAALINVVAILNNTRYDQTMASIGIFANDKKKILKSLESGILLIDCTIKSLEEIIAMGLERNDRSARMMSQRYRDNGFVPIESLLLWKGLVLNTITFFQNPDNAVANRDDALFAKRLREVNFNGKNIILEGDEGGHCGFHKSLWKAYAELVSKSGI
jgi:hypothetical protein